MDYELISSRPTQIETGHLGKVLIRLVAETRRMNVVCYIFLMSDLGMLSRSNILIPNYIHPIR